MTSEERNKLLLSDTQVPDLFIAQYMSSLSAESIRIYLYLLMNDASTHLTVDVKTLSHKLGMSIKDVDEQLFYLCKAGLVDRTKDDKIVLIDIKAKEVDRYIEAKAQEDLEMPPQHVDPALDQLSKSISDTFFMGRMSYIWQHFIDDSSKVHKLDADVIYSLFVSLQEKGKLKNTRAAEDLRADWCARGVKTSSDLEKVIEQDNRIAECVELLGKKTRRKFDEVDIDYISKWMTVYQMQPDVPSYLYTYLRKEKKKEKVSFAEMDILLEEWFSHNIHDVKAASAYETKKMVADRTQALTTFCGELFRKKLDGVDLSIIEKWANVDAWEEPIIRYAYEVLHHYMGTITLANVDDRLSLWKENGIASVTKAREFEAESKKKNKEAYRERKTASPDTQKNALPILENEYTQQTISDLESDPLKDLEQLLGTEK